MRRLRSAISGVRGRIGGARNSRARLARPTLGPFKRGLGADVSPSEDRLTRHILITGGAGFIGSAVVRSLVERGDHVTVLDTGSAAGFDSLTGLALRIVAGDIRNAELVADAAKGCDSVVHLAAQPGVSASVERPVDDFAVNAGATLNVLEAARRAGVGRFVFASSNAVVAGHPPPAHEQLTPRPVSPYGAGKAAAEAYMRAYFVAYRIETVVLRFANAYGPWSLHKSSVVAAFIRDFLAGRPLTIRGDGGQTRDVVHAADLAWLVLRSLDAAARDVAGEVFQAGSGRETSVSELARLVCEAGGGIVPIQHVPPLPGDVPRNFSDIGKARRVLGYEPAIDLPTGLAETMAWFRHAIEAGKTG